MIYQDTTAIEAVNNGIDQPDAFYKGSKLIATSKWHSTDGWRGYNKVTPEPGYKLVNSDWATGDWGDAIAEEHGETATERKLQELEAEYGDVFVIFTPTSNVFSTAYDVIVKDPEAKPDKSKLVAHKTRLYESDNGDWRIRYHATDVVSYNAKKREYTLNTGGWNTPTTVKRMREYTPFRVYRKNWVVYADHNGKTYEVDPTVTIKEV